MRFALLANPENRRASFFAAACGRLGLPAPAVISWDSFLSGGPETLAATLRGCDALRIESPGENWQVERRLIALGAEACAAEGIHPSIAAGEAIGLPDDRGRVRFGRQWYHGWCAALERVGEAMAATGIPAMNPPEAIALMFDKAAAQAHLAATGVPIPRPLGTPSGFDNLLAMMASARVSRLFLKPCHGSSGAGVVAFQRHANDGRMLAICPAEIVRDGAGARLYNSLRVTRFTTAADLRALIDAVCAERAHAEAWFPKAGFRGRAFDLRVVVIGGEARHCVARTSAGPITNLHLGNTRGDLDAICRRMGDEAWHEARRVCQLAARAFPRCAYAAIDLLVGTDFASFAVAEVNAFGDLLPGIQSQGQDTYTAALAAWIDSPEPNKPPPAR